MVEVTDRAGWQREVVEASRERPVVVDFWAPWCQPCRVLGPVLERLAAEDAGRWSLVKVDVQAHPELAEPYRVEGIPAVFGFRDGEVADQFTGALPAGAVREWLDGLAPDPCAEAVAAGDLAQRGGDPALARAEYERALALDPSNPGALLGLAEVDPGGGWLARVPPDLSPAHAARRARLTLAAEAAGADVGALRA
ncbi:MAG: thioredoxin domain-containing protein, partial [Myxococcota bacterium]